MPIGILEACREKRKRVQARRTAGLDHRIDRRQITGLKKRAVEDDGGNGAPSTQLSFTRDRSGMSRPGQ